MATLPNHTGNTDGAYWTEQWKANATGWRVRERQQLPFAKNAYLLLKSLVTTVDVATSEDAIIASLRQAFAGVTIFVPLCGDTPALGFWSQAVGCNVVGVDIVEVSVRRAIEEQFASQSASAAAVESVVSLPGGAAELKRVFLPRAAASEGDVTLFIGDALALLESEEVHELLGHPALIYDRASMIALSPQYRTRYIQGIRRLLQSPTAMIPAKLEANAKRAMLLSVIERHQDIETAGPPFHISRAAIDAAYGDLDRIVVSELWNERDLLVEGATSATEKPPFVDVVYSVRVE